MCPSLQGPPVDLWLRCADLREDGGDLSDKQSRCNPPDANCWHDNGNRKWSKAEQEPETAKRGGYTDVSGTCISFHCGSRTPGTLQYLLCVSRHGCIGRRKRWDASFTTRFRNTRVVARCVNCFGSGLTWFLTCVIFASTWRFPLWLLIRIGCSCYRLQSWREIICTSYPSCSTVWLCQILWKSVRIKKVIAETRRGGEFIFETQCIELWEALIARNTVLLLYGRYSTVISWSFRALGR